MNDQLAIRQDQALMPTTFDGLMEQAKVIFQSGLLPKSVQTPAAAVAIMLTGRELGITPMQSFRSIYIVDGTPTLSAQFIAAKLLEAGVTYHVPQMTSERCTIEFSRNNGMTLTYTYTWEDATNAGLTTKRNWRQYAKDMLWSRCMTLGGRKIAPDALLGFHTADELGAVVDPQSGQVIDSIALEVSGEEPIGQTSQAPKSEEATDKSPEAPQSEMEQGEPTTTKPHWIENEQVRKRFWAWTTKMALNSNEVHEALEIEHIGNYDGSMLEAKDQIIAYVNRKAGEKPELAADGVPSEDIPI